MFEPIEEYVEGAACVHCWGNGKTFGDIPTPKRIEMTGSGFVGGDAPLNDTFIALQDPVIPCIWFFDNGTVWGIWTVRVANTGFEMGLTGQPASYQRTEALCALVSAFGVESVTIEITEPPTPEWKTAIDQNFSPNEQTHYKDLGDANSDEVLIIARRRDQIKLLVRYEPDY